MNDRNDQSETSKRPEPKEDLICEVCGRFGAVEIGDHRLCPDCYEKSGSCCPEFGADDLWTDQPADEKKRR